MMKRKSIFIIVLILLSVVCGLFPKDQVSAWWGEKDKNGKKIQCFAIQYKYVNKYENNGKTAQDTGETERTAAQQSSTKKICAYVDSNGKVTGKIQFQDWPSDTTKIPINDSKLSMSINSDGNELTISSCSKSGYACDSGKAVTKKTFKVNDSTFEAFAQSVLSAAPATYGNQKRIDNLKENATKTSAKEEAEAMDVDGGKDDDEGGGSSIKETCANQGGAQSLGWIVCPVMELLGEASENIYAKYVEPSLTVDPKLFSDDNESVRHGWETFRDIANILFVILLLIVIFSQLTGVGIDNYGIKKIIPKLVVVAVLINLSFVICVLAVDISNILGNSFQALFNGLSDTLPSPEDINVDEGSIIPGLSAEGVLVSVGVLGAAVVAGGKMWKNPAIVLSLLISAVGVFISIIFLFLMLAVREAAIVVLTVISPVAMVCYMLPNVKKYFDRWLKGFQGLLLVYPICGLMVGGGNYVARLLLTAGFAQEGFISAFTSMIAGIVPIFFIPMVLKNSFSALGNIGGMISNLGRGVSRGATGSMRGSQAYRNAQEMGWKRQNRIEAGLDKNGNLTSMGRFRAGLARTGVGRFVGADTRLARKVDAANRNFGEQVDAGAALTSALATAGIANAAAIQGGAGGFNGFAANTEGAYYGQQFIDAARRGDRTGMDAALKAMNNSNMKPKDIASLVRHVEASGGPNFADEGQAAEWRGKMFSQYGNGFLSTDAELSHYMKTRGAGGEAAQQDLAAGHGAYAKNNMGIDDIRPEDVKALSGDSMAGLVSAGLLTQGMAQTVLASNPNISEDKKIILSATANGNTGAVNSSNENIEDIRNEITTLAKGIKTDAENMMKDHAVIGTAIKNTDSRTVDAWTSAVPQNVNIVQNFNAGGAQMQPVDIKIQHTPPSRPGTNIGGAGGVDSVSE